MKPQSTTLQSQHAKSSLVTQPMLQLRPNWTELRSMDYYHQIFCRFRKCKRKVPLPSLLSNDFEKSCFFFKKFTNVFVFFFAYRVVTVEELFDYIFGIYKRFGYKDPSILATSNSVSVAT